MRIEAALIANHAVVGSDNLLKVDGAGWEFSSAAIFPVTISGYVAGIAALEGDEVGNSVPIVIEVGTGNAHVQASRGAYALNGLRPAAASGVPTRAPFAIPFTITANDVTVVDVRLLDAGGTEVAVLTFSVQSTTPNTLPH